MVNETFVSTYLRGEDPDGGVESSWPAWETLADPVREPWFEIVGVVADVTNQGLQAPVEPASLGSVHRYRFGGAQVLLVRSEQTPTALMNDVRQAVLGDRCRRCGTGLPERAGGSHRQTFVCGPSLFAFLLMTIFGCLGLILVTVGVL